MVTGIALPSSFNSITDTQSSEAGVTLTHLFWDLEIMYFKMLDKFTASLREVFW